MVKRLLQLESLAFLLGSLYLYSLSGASWWVFVFLIFAPDISMLGYLKDKEYGARLYNIGHSYVLAISLIALAVLTDIKLIMSVGLILFSHISLDRMLGFGLKYRDSFKETHMQKV